MARILIVDDEPDILLMLRMHVEIAGHEVVLAADGDQALRRIREQQPDVVLLDVMMPVLDGWSVLRSAKADDLEVPVIVVSARSGAADLRRAYIEGAVDYVVKPYAADQLVAKAVDVAGWSTEQRDAARAELLARVSTAESAELERKNADGAPEGSIIES